MCQTKENSGDFNKKLYHMVTKTNKSILSHELASKLRLLDCLLFKFFYLINEIIKLS